MRQQINLCLLTILLTILAACAGNLETPSPFPATATSDASFASNGGGEPRNAGYWLLWNSCAPENRSTLAAANGGREAGWVVMDDLLNQPGILIGTLQIETCVQGAD